MDPINTTLLQWLAVEGGYACSYTRAYVILGTQRPATEVLDAYSEQLPRLGWVLRTESYHLELMPVLRIFIRGRHERLVIEPLGEGTEVADSVDHEALKRTYATLLVVRIDYMLPQRDNC